MSGASQRKEKVTAVILLGASLLYLFGSLHLKMGTVKNPGPGFVPVVIGMLLFVCTTVYTMGLLRTKGPGSGKLETRSEEAKNYRALIGVMACITGYALVLESLKYILSTLIVTFAMLVILKSQRLMVSFLVAVGIAVASFVVLSVYFQVALPFGRLENLVFQIGR